jgi:hypothetical protein
LNTLLIVVAVLVAPALVFAGTANKFALGKATMGTADEVVVPVVITNDADLTAIDIPLQYSDGVTLQRVDFEGTRTEYFDLKIANINAEENQVIIGLLPQLSAKAKPDLAAGTGAVANLVFTIDNPMVTEINVETFETENPGHALMFVYHTYDENGVPGQYTVYPEFEPITVALANLSGANLPATFALKQNYPNPFNPSTEIAFDLPKSSNVNLTIYNVLGQQVETLVDSRLDAGAHVVTWDANRYSSGVYFYRITTENNVETKKMMLLK